MPHDITKGTAACQIFTVFPVQIQFTNQNNLITYKDCSRKPLSGFQEKGTKQNQKPHQSLYSWEEGEIIFVNPLSVI